MSCPDPYNGQEFMFLPRAIAPYYNLVLKQIPAAPSHLYHASNVLYRTSYVARYLTEYSTCIGLHWLLGIEHRF